MTSQQIFLVGLSGAGKSTIGKLIAANLGWMFADSDAAIVEMAGRSIPDIFRDEGEQAFREREAAALHELASHDSIVIATGGGAPTTDDCRRVLDEGFVVWLSVSPERAAQRLQSDSDAEVRPLLGSEPQARLETLLAERRAVYQQSDASIDVDSLTPEQAAEEVVHLFHEWREHERDADRPAPEATSAVLNVAATVHTSTASYPIVVEERALHLLGVACRDAGVTGRAFIITDEDVAALYANDAATALDSAGYRSATLPLPSGESNKTLATVSRVYDWLIENHIERSDFVVCLGGGVVTDLGGFAAATCLRGIDFIHVPTTMLGMVDAAIGGKTGVDVPQGKNLVGAFAQPRAVIIDPTLLDSLPDRQVRAGMAELVKHGFILDESLVRDLESASGNMAAMQSAAMIARSVAIKAAVVSDDEREAGRRTLLNYGHTIGHAIETVTGYGSFLHGEAVAIGMHAAGLIARELEILSPPEFERQQALIRAVGLPQSAPGLDGEAILATTLRDKKVREGSVSWVLLEAIGRATVRRGVPDDVVRRAVATVIGEA